MLIKPYLLFSAMLLFSLSATAQPVPNPTDTSYVMELLKKGEAIENQQITTALADYKKAYAFSKKIKYTKGYFESIRLMAFTLNNLGRHDEARKLAQEALVKARQDTSKRNLGISYFVLANTALFAGRFSDAIPNYQQAAHYMRSMGKLKNVAVINQNLGHIYETQRLYPRAIEFYRKSLAFNLTDTADRRSVAIDYFSIGTVLDKMHRFPESKAYFLKARQYVDPEKDLDFMINLYSNIGQAYGEEARFDSALYYNREALGMSRKLGNPRHEMHLLVVLAQMYNHMKNYSRAKELLDQANAITAKNKFGLTELRNLYREYYYAESGLHHYKEAVKWSYKHDTTDSLLVTTENREFLRDYEVKLKQAESRQKISEKQHQIDLLNEEKKQQRLWLVIAVLTAVVIATGLGLGYLYYRQRQRTAETTLLAAQREGELAAVQSELQGQQKERLRISKEMHDDLGASLTAIGLLSEVVKTRMGPNTTPEVEKISSISADMVTSMNEIIWSLNTKNDSLNGLIAYTRSYASEFIDNTDLTLRTEVNESPREIMMRGTDRRNVFLTVKEALNNVVKHAQASEVMLRMQPEINQLLIEVRDNGKGFTPSQNASLRNGLSNMQSRMAESGGSCEILPSTGGTTVKITYPYPTASIDKIRQMQYSI